MNSGHIPDFKNVGTAFERTVSEGVCKDIKKFVCKGSNERHLKDYNNL